MKKTLILIAMLAVAFSASAQDKKDQDPKERFFKAKVKEMVYHLDITDEQKPEFVKVYKAYTEAIREVSGQNKPGRPMPPKDGFKKGEKPQADAPKPKHERKQMTTEEAVKNVKDRLERQTKAAAENAERQAKANKVKLQYVDEFAKVLTPEQLNRFFMVEQQINQKLRNRQPGPGMKGFNGRPGMNGQRPNGPRPDGPRPGDNRPAETE